MSIDQLQAEAGREGLRAKALEAGVLRPLIRETGGLQALISQTNTMRVLVDKAGGVRELELFVSDLRTIRDTLGELRGSRGLLGLAAEVRDLFKSKQQLDGLASEVDGPNGLREKVAKYERLTKAFVEVQNMRTLAKPVIDNAAMNPARARMITNTPLEADPNRDLYEAPPPVAKPNKTGSNNTPLGTPQDQPPSARLAQGSREFSIQHARKASPRRRRSRNSPLAGLFVSQSGQLFGSVAGQKVSLSKRPGVRSQILFENGTASSALREPIERKESNALFISGVKDEEEAIGLLAAQDRPKIEKIQNIKHFFIAHFNSNSEMRAALERVPAGVKNARGGPTKPSVKIFNDRSEASMSVAKTVDVYNSDSLLDCPSIVDVEGLPSSLPHAGGTAGRTAKTDAVDSVIQMHTKPSPMKMPDWMRTDVHFGRVGFSSAAGIPRYSSTPPAQDGDFHTDTRLGPVHFLTEVTSLPPLSSHTLGKVGEAQTALQAVAAVPADPCWDQMTIWKDFLRHDLAFWVGSSDASAAWDAYQLYNLKRNFQIPGDLLASLIGELSKSMPIAKYSVYEKMAPNRNTCILR